jgi:hypothetical protein
MYKNNIFINKSNIMEKILAEEIKRIKIMMEQIMDDNIDDEEEGETKAEFAGTWIVVNLNDEIYHVLVTGDSRENSIAVILDGQFNKVPYEKWDEIEQIVDNFTTDHYGDF